MVVASTSAATTPPAAATIRRRQHPPYKEMILKAIETLKNRNGSSRRAISKFIATNYADLPPAHDSLLSLHLSRLHTNGLLVMFKHSYKLAPSIVTTPTPSGAPPKRPSGRPPKKNTVSITSIPHELNLGEEGSVPNVPEKSFVPVANTSPKRRHGHHLKLTTLSLSAVSTSSTAMKKHALDEPVPWVSNVILLKGTPECPAEVFLDVSPLEDQHPGPSSVDI